MRQKFGTESINFKPESLAMLEKANQILAEYKALGYDMTLRQLFYQMVTKNWIKNSDRSYKNLGNLIGNARKAGLVDWDSISDRGRDTHFLAHFNSPAHILDAAISQYREDKWENQPVHLEVMVEKQALENILIPVCQEMDVRFTANKGYPSLSLSYEIGQRLAKMIDFDKDIVILYLGDFDPSGWDMTRDVLDKMQMFSENYEGRITVERIALNEDQIEKWNPPPNAAKLKDSRAKEYIKKYGRVSWELDAIKVDDLASLLETEILRYRDDDLWDEAVERETHNRGLLNKYRKQAEKEQDD